MKKQNALLFYFLPLLALIGASLAIYNYSLGQRLQILVKERQEIEAIVRAMKAIDNIWNKGIVSPSCLEKSDYKNVDKSYLRCNLSLLNCSLSKFSFGELSDFKIVQKNDRYYEEISRVSANVEVEDGYAVAIVLKEQQTHKLFTINLESNCSDVYLPQRVYGYDSSLSSGKDLKWLWDNKKIHLFIDKYLVTNGEVNSWIGSENLEIEKKYPLHFESTSLTLSQMKSFCYFRGKVLAGTKELEAASFYPSKSKKINNSKLRKHPYPWTRRKRESFLYQANKDPNYQVTEADCRKAFVRDCFSLSSKQVGRRASRSWTGLSQILGGVLEASHNSIEGKKNINTSSFYYNASSSVHKVGAKISWNGNGHLDKDLDWGGHPPNNIKRRSIEIGFRCMKEQYAK